MIVKLQDFTEKSFKNYSTADDFFKQKNLIFGYNGRGKSSLATGLAKKFTEGGGSKDDLRIFNKDYIKESMLIESTGEITGVSITIDKKNVDIKDEISRIQKSKVEEEVLKSQIEDITKTISSSISSINKLKKGDLDIKIKRVDAEKGLLDTLKRYRNDIEEAKKIQPNIDKLKNYQGDNSTQEHIDKLDNLSVPDISIDHTIFDKDKIDTIFKESYKDINVPSSVIVSWLSQGLDYHHNRDKCYFCGGELNYQAVKDKVNQYQEDEKQKSELYLKGLKDALELWVEKIDNSFSDKYISLIAAHLDEPKVQTIKQKADDYKIKIQEFAGIFNSKILNMSDDKPFEKYDDMIRLLSDINENNTDLVNLRKDKLDALREEQESRDILVKGSIGLAIMNDKNVKDNVTKLKDKNKELEDLIIDNKDKDRKIRDLIASMSTYDDFRVFLNGVLSDLSIDLKLEPCENNKDYKLVHSKETDIDLTIDDISEGEKNLLALLYFYFELYKDKRQNRFKKDIKLVIIDDPISSLDGANRFYVLEIVKKMFDICDSQIFILTHSWDDFSQMAYGKKTYTQDSNSKTEFYEIYKNNSSESAIRLIKSTVKPYKKLFTDIYELSTRKQDYEMTEADIYNIPNSMRRVFEEFLKFKYDGDIIPTKTQQIKVENVINNCVKGRKIGTAIVSGDSYLSPSKKIKLGQLLTITNVLSHKSRYNPTEVYESSKFLMKLIEDMDPAHYNAMKV